MNHPFHNAAAEVDAFRWRVGWRALIPASLCWVLGCVALSAEAAGVGSPTPTQEAMRLLKSECSGCHNAEKHKGGLNLSDREGVLKGGENGAVISPENVGRSRLLEVLQAEADPHMPPKKQLAPSDVATLRRWIEEGAGWDALAWKEEDPARDVVLDPLPTSFHPIGALAVSPDGKRLAVGRGGWLLVFDLGQTNFPLIGSWEAHADVVQSLAWSPDGQELASGGLMKLALWGGAPLKREREWTNGLIGRVMALEFSPDGQRLAVAHGGQGSPGLIRLLPLRPKDTEFSWKAHADTVFDLEFSHDGKRLVTAGGDRLIRVWDVDRQQEIAALEGHVAQVLTVAFNTNATQVASGGADKELKVWDIATHEKLVSLGQHTSAIAGLAWASESQRLFAVREDGVGLRYSDLKAHNGEQSSASGQEHRMGEVSEGATCLALSPDRKRVIVGNAAGLVQIWDADGKNLCRLDAQLPHSAMPGGKPASRPSERSQSPSVAKARLTSEPRSVQSFSDGTTPVVRLQAAPPEIQLDAGAVPHGLLITAVHEDGFERDVTTQARFIPSPQAPFELGVYGELRGLRPGTGRLTALFGGRRVEIPVTVRAVAPAAKADDSAAEEVSFVRDVLPALSRAGCNAGACHAKPDGQNGFRLTVFSFDPKTDYQEIVREARGRRIFPSAPELSLLLRKPSGGLPHEGGVRFDPGSPTYELLVRWMRSGMPYQIDREPVLTGITVFPREQRYAKGSTQKLLVQARYSDGSVRDVTRLAAFVSNDKELVKVSESGRMEVGRLTGLGVVVARFMGYVADAQVLVPADHGLPAAQFARLPRNNFIDEHAYAHFQRLGILPSDLCSDLEFLRRAKLDAIGVLPTPEEVSAFQSDPFPAKRARFIDRILEDPAYTDYWANKWADLLRPNPDRVGVKSIFTLDQWLRESFRSNKPYDRFVREILVAEGSNHREGPAVIYRDRREPADLTTMFSQLFLGTRLECARCHHHPNEKWGQEDFYQFAAFFGPLKQKGAGLSPPISAGTETFYFAPGGAVKHPVTGSVMAPRPPEGPDLKLPETVDPRRALADWLTAPDNPFFARAAVNRVWAAFFGRGLVEPVDDFRISNPCVNPALLNALAEDFVKHGYDLKHLMRTLMMSRLYQLSSTPNEHNLSDTRNFSRAYRRRLPAEVLMDAVSDVTGLPDPLVAMPLGARAMQAWSYKIESHFLDAFGRPNSSSDCPCERDLQLSVVQSLHLMNSKALQGKLSHREGRVHRLADGPLSPERIVEELYLLTLNRPPTETERRKAVRAYAETGASRQTATEDVLWALLNSAEFVFNH